MVVYFSGPGALDGVQHQTGVMYFWDCFFFSVQTLATIGYGRITPIGIIPNLIVTVEALAGLMSVAIMTGLVFARFSRPTAKVIFSNVGIITPIEGQLCFVCRLGNKRLNQIVDARITAVLLKAEVTKEGEKYRELYDLKLERETTPIFSMSWTVVHPITASSPLYKMDKATMEAAEVEILISVSGRDETLSQDIRARFSYTADDIYWNHRFVDIINRNQKGQVVVDFDSIHNIQTII